MGPRDFNGMYRYNEEEFHLADGTTLRRLEKGEPSKATMCQHNLNAVSYTHLMSNKRYIIDLRETPTSKGNSKIRNSSRWDSNS